MCQPLLWEATGPLLAIFFSGGRETPAVATVVSPILQGVVDRGEGMCAALCDSPVPCP